MKKGKKAVSLLSGGIDSAVASAIAKKAGYLIYGLSFDYGQTHRFELSSAKKLAKHLGFANHIIFPLPLKQFGASALLGKGRIPKGRSKDEMQSGIPNSYVPARNLVFLAIGSAYAESIAADAVVIGAHTLDYSGYPDCRPEFMDAFQKAVNLGTKAGVEKRLIKIWAPLINMSKVEIIKTGLELGLDFSLTLSCYDPDEKGRACGECDSCVIRKKAFQDIGKRDPGIYR
jgi:7-cyano-7-deazaguanine synthase